MSDIISARCFGCGHTIKVPAGLGGKKARCPQCTNTINIPNPNDTQHEDILSDADLPEVAVDSHKFVREEGDVDHPDAVAPEKPVEDPSEARRRSSGTGVRRAVKENITSASHPRVQRSGTQPRYAGQGAVPAKKPAASSNQGMIIGIALGVVALLIIGFAVANKGSKQPTHQPKTGKDRDREGTVAPKTPQYSPEDQALVSRTLDYAATVNRGDATQVMNFYTYDPEEQRRTRIRATELVDQKVTYENPQVSSVSAASGTITFTYGGGKTKSLQWKQVDNVWLIAEKPSP